MEPLASLALLIADLSTQIRALQEELLQTAARDNADNP